MKLLDAFAGIGGFSLAAHQLGWETVGFIEKDEFCQQILRKSFGKEILIHDDIYTATADTFPGFDILTAGLPCQAYSQAGKRQGEKDPRFLFPPFFDFVAATKPRWVVIENVYGLLNIHSCDTFEKIAARLENEGYTVQTFCIPASAANAWHRRDRIWIIAHSQKSRTGQNKRGLRSGIKRHSERSKETGKQQTSSNSQSERCGETGQHSERSEKRTPGTDSTHFTADSATSGLQGSGHEPGQQKILSKDGIELGNSDATNSKTKRLERHGKPEKTSEISRERFYFTEGISQATNWLEVASELCRMDDGLPAELVASERKSIYNAVGYFGWKEVSKRIGIDCRQVENRLHRTKRLKALGNSVYVPLVYEILKAIDYADKNSLT